MGCVNERRAVSVDYLFYTGVIELIDKYTFNK